MNQKKIGEFITKCRKKKKITQEGLGEILGINGRSVSKWERGLNMPDLEKLPLLAKELDITVSELLKGELNTDENKEDDSSFESIEFYVKDSKKKILIITSIIISVMLFIFSLIFFFSNFAKNKIYTISSLNDEIILKGYLFMTPEQNIIVINNLDYQSDTVGTNKEPTIKEISIYLNNDNAKIISYSKIFSNESVPLSSALNQLSLSGEESKKQSLNVLSYNDDLDNMILVIEFTDSNDEFTEIKVNLEVNEEYSNNKIFY